MDEVEHAYTPPQTMAANTVPAQVARYLDGTELLTKTEALRLSTVSQAGWPHAALLSAGDMLVVAPGRIRFAIFPQSETTANLARDGRLALTLSVDGGMCELLMRARRLAHAAPEVPLAFFEAEVEKVRVHAAPYASVTSGITFALRDPQAVLRRWQRQIAALRAAR
ncbi:MAG TPA: pyridoxamine 5'-phosphate oxidase family protein [Stellaceae bacterium]|nr:pyridoxamine 5'-phosphate oxidase family protein [Stellaceae bacterium]